MPAPSLLTAARRACINNMRSITDIGDAPYGVVRPVLLKLENPEQLKQLETKSPQLIGCDAELWLEFIRRDVPDWENKPHQPKNPANWYKVYRKLLRDSENESRKDAELLKARLDDIKKEKSEHKLKQVELDCVKLPKDMKRTGEVLILKQKIQMRDTGVKTPMNISTKTQQKPPQPSKGKLDHLRKIPKGMSLFSQKPKAPTGVITAREISLKQKSASTIVKAPRAMIEEHRIAGVAKPFDPLAQTPAIFNPKKRKIQHDEDARPSASNVEEREKRLKAFTNPSTSRRSPPTIKPPRAQRPTQAGSSPVPSLQDNTHRQAANDESPSRVSYDKPDSPGVPTLMNKRIHESLMPGSQIPRANTSSPSNGGIRPVMKTKQKAPVDIFMRPNKRPRIAS